MAVCMGSSTAIYKIDFVGKKLEQLQKFESDFSPVDPCSNCLMWSRDNAGLAVGGDDKIVRLFKAASPKDFKTPFEMVCELKDGHHEAINCIDISPSKTLLISSGNDSQACVWDLRKRTLIKKLTFRDKECKDQRGNVDTTNFNIRGCIFAPDGQFVYLLASKTRFKSYLVCYSIIPVSQDNIMFSPVKVLDVHDNAATKISMSPDSSLLSISTNDGYVKVVDRASYKILLSQKRHKLPVTCSGWYGSDRPSHIFSGSADYSYNLIPVPGGGSFVGNIVSHVIYLLLVQMPILLAILLFFSKAME
jgi:WD40 repeat protein